MYEKLGFHAVLSVIEAEGLHFIQMQKAFTA
ncbi:hypothetical protein [Acinetobacter pragensis]